MISGQLYNVMFQTEISITDLFMIVPSCLFMGHIFMSEILNVTYNENFEKGYTHQKP